MSNLIVVNNPRDWPLDIPGVTVVPARAYLTDPAYGGDRMARVFNLCKSYRYQTLALLCLAARRGARPQAAAALEHHRRPAIAEHGAAADRGAGRPDPEVAEADQVGHLRARHLLRPQHGEPPRTTQPPAFQPAPCPLLRAEFERRGQHWRIRSVRPIAASDIPPSTRSSRCRPPRNTSPPQAAHAETRRTALQHRHPA